ncbi:Tad domain-containing protein [Bradyrhizobium sp. AUGA SZCCT0169]|uniref:TadE/TadG family type IV pilus assembly protein n=1 Tax=Bradyrhizobium sp. AUGA SZCCT0169 TaxID=2807663 RepID=UPI001BA8C8FD|nr:TadE/TadG family type IV pilus assembly protein [Bradyrhizobium sp. AUGA SZCCT0169]MBR1251480.1 Tad domain-containing protein [Bradyrhizobium sp. AUGA SZCCT0169]
MTALIMRLRRLVTTFRDDTRGAILPYVTIMLVVFVGFGALALDGGRYMSMQTQMQAVADGLALAGARELNQRSGARARAASAIDTLVSNGLTGMGYSGAITHAAPVFYSALPVATAGFTGTPATSDLDAKFVAVTVNPVTVPTIMPIRFFQSAGVNNISTGARAIAGFLGRAVCDMPPVFICNPYETSGMSDSAATAALRAALDVPGAPATKRMLRMNMSKTSPGHFGYLVPPDSCNGASCLKDWIARTHPPACYQTPGVDLNTGNKTAVSDAFNVRFDIYSGSLNYSVDYAPDVNVRKGYLPKNGNWCTAAASSPVYHTTDYPDSTNPRPPIIETTGTTTTSGNATEKKTITSVPAADVSNAFTTGGNNDDKQMVSGANIQPNTDIDGPGSAPTTSLLMSKVAATAGSAPLTIKWKTSGFPQDKSWTGICADGSCIEGDGNWDCTNYWKLNHPAQVGNPPPGCYTTPPTTSRYDVYNYEIANNLVGDWSGNGLPNTGGGTQGNGESGAPYCAGPNNGVAKRRIIHAAIINCLAHSGLITGGSTANNIPVADFGKFFMTQPVDATAADGAGVLYGEMSGLVGSLDEVRIMNQVQLYR